MSKSVACEDISIWTKNIYKEISMTRCLSKVEGNQTSEFYKTITKIIIFV